MSSEPLRPMRVTEILDRTFSFYRTHLVPMLTVGLMVYLPAAAITVILAYLLGLVEAVEQFQTGEFDPAADFRDTLGAVIALSVIGAVIYFVIVQPLSVGAMIRLVSSRYLGEPISAGQAIVKAIPLIPVLFLIQVIVGLVTILGFIALIVPGVIFIAWFAVAMQAAVLERLGPLKAMARSRELIRGHVPRTLGLLLLVMILALIISGFLGLLVEVLVRHMVARMFLNELIDAAVLPLTLIPVILLYYDLRVRKEAFDIEQLARSLGVEGDWGADGGGGDMGHGGPGGPGGFDDYGHAGPPPPPPPPPHAGGGPRQPPGDAPSGDFDERRF